MVGMSTVNQSCSSWQQRQERERNNAHVRMFLQNLCPSAQLCLLSIHDLPEQPIFWYTNGCFVFNWRLRQAHRHIWDSFPLLPWHPHHHSPPYTHSGQRDIFCVSQIPPASISLVTGLQLRGEAYAKHFTQRQFFSVKGQLASFQFLSTYSCPYISSKKKQINAK